MLTFFAAQILSFLNERREARPKFLSPGANGN
jgi:hypothetical protein